MPRKKGKEWASELKLWFHWASSSSELKSESRSLVDEGPPPKLKNLKPPPPLFGLVDEVAVLLLFDDDCEAEGIWNKRKKRSAELGDVPLVAPDDDDAGAP